MISEGYELAVKAENILRKQSKALKESNFPLYFKLERKWQKVKNSILELK